MADSYIAWKRAARKQASTTPLEKPSKSATRPIREFIGEGLRLFREEQGIPADGLEMHLQQYRASLLPRGLIDAVGMVEEGDFGLEIEVPRFMGFMVTYMVSLGMKRQERRLVRELLRHTKGGQRFMERYEEAEKRVPRMVKRYSPPTDH